MSSTSNIYRIIPFLWNDARQGLQTAVTAYGADRAPANLDTACASRPKEDPASYWDGPTIARLVMPAAAAGGCPAAAVTWQSLPAWMSYAQAQGYTIVGGIGKLKPYSEFYISGP